VVAISVFAILFAFIASYWMQAAEFSKATMAKSKLEFIAIGTSDFLVKSKGAPANWETNASSVQMIGLASAPNVLSSAKLANFTSNVTYNTSKLLLGLGRGEYFFYVEDMGGSRLYEKGNSSIDVDRSVAITRFALLNSQKVRVRLIAYVQ
jgi:hypothetical protein